MKRLICVLVVALLCGCDKGSIGGGSVGSGQSISTTDAQDETRTKTQELSKSARAAVTMPASALIFPELVVKLGDELDQQISINGANAIKGAPLEQLGQIITLATRPMVAWPVDPIDQERKALRWAQVVNAAVVVTDRLSQQLVLQLPARTMVDEADAKRAIRSAFDGLPVAELLREFRALASEAVTLDLADTTAVRFVSDSGQVSIDGSGATLMKTGVLQFGGVHGAIGGKAYALSLERAGTSTMARQRGMTAGDGSSQDQSTTTNAGVK